MDYYHKTKIVIKVLGAGQTVGRSCVIVELENRRIMFDCGIHLGFKDKRKYPNFNLLVNDDNYESNFEETYDPLNTEINISIINTSILDKEKLIKNLKSINEIIDCVIISHFHMDHIGALPFFTEVLNYKGPILMSYPTKALSPILLMDSSKVTDIKWEKKNFERQVKMISENPEEVLDYNLNSIKKDPWNITEENITNCINKVIGLQINETYQLGDIYITPYYAGHVLGACIFKIEVNNLAVVYTGDYNTIPDKHLGCANIPSLNPEILISESTYAAYIRSSRKSSELELCNIVHECINRNGKVLIPVFAIGRAQELAILLNEYWDKMKIDHPIYFGGGLTENANKYYKIYSNWTNENCNFSYKKKNLFHFKHIYQFHNNFLTEKRAMVLFATPGMIHTGLSLRAFKCWATDPNNLIVLPGYCVQGTVGHKLILGEKKINIDNNTCINVVCKIIYLSFSAHADSNGIQQLIRHTLPKCVVFVHGEKNNMEKLSSYIHKRHLINSVCPSLGQNCEFLFEKANVDYVYLHINLYKYLIDTIEKKNKKKEDFSFLKDKMENKILFNEEDIRLASYNKHFSIPFYAILFCFLIKQDEKKKPFFFFISKQEALIHLKKKYFNIYLEYKNKEINTDKLFKDSRNKAKRFINYKKKKKKRQIEKKDDEDYLNKVQKTYENQSIDFKNNVKEFEENKLSNIKKKKINEFIENEKNINNNNNNNKSSSKSSISSYDDENENKNENKYIEYNNKNNKIDNLKYDKYTKNENEENIEKKEIKENYNENNFKYDDENNNKSDEYIKDNQNNIEDDDNEYTPTKLYSKTKKLPLINLRFKEHIQIKYKNFYNFVLTFFQEIIKSNKNKIDFLGDKIIIKNVKYENHYFFLLSFHSLKAIHNGNNSLFIQWSYIDDYPNSVVSKFIDSIYNYLEDNEIK